MAAIGQQTAFFLERLLQNTPKELIFDSFMQLANVIADLMYGYKKHNENLSPEEFLRLLELSSTSCPEPQ